MVKLTFFSLSIQAPRHSSRTFLYIFLSVWSYFSISLTQNERILSNREIFLGEDMAFSFLPENYGKAVSWYLQSLTPSIYLWKETNNITYSK